MTVQEEVDRSIYGI